MRKFMCPSDKAFLADLQARGVVLTVYDAIYFEDPYYDGKRWAVRRFDAAGTHYNGTISLVRSGDVRRDARTIYHEGLHAQQPRTMSKRDKEYEAYVKTEEWGIERGVPPMHELARTKENGRTVPNEEVLKAFVDHMYPGLEAQAGASTERVIGRTSDGQTTVLRADGTTYSRPPRKGDSYSGPEVTVPKGGLPLKLSDLQCE